MEITRNSLPKLQNESSLSKLQNESSLTNPMHFTTRVKRFEFSLLEIL